MRGEESGGHPDPRPSHRGDPHADSGLQLGWLSCTWPSARSRSPGHVAASPGAPGSLTQSTKNDNLVQQGPANPPFRKGCSLGHQPGMSRSQQRRGLAKSLAFLGRGCGQQYRVYGSPNFTGAIFTGSLSGHSASWVTQSPD